MRCSLKKLMGTFFGLFLVPSQVLAKEVALTFDDAPVQSTTHYNSEKRTEELIQKLKFLKVSQVGIFANPCKRDDTDSVVGQLKKYFDEGHLIANHTCSHPRFDEIGFPKFSADAEKADKALAPLIPGQKFFRFPFLNEGTDAKLRDKMRVWLRKNHYRNGLVSIDNDDYLFSAQINWAKQRKNRVDYEQVKALFLEHLLGAADFYDELAVKTLGRSPKHVLLLHEMDATVMFIEELVTELRKQGWKIIDIAEAYKDPLYSIAPKNTYGNNGIIAQINFEKTGAKVGYFKFNEVKEKLNKILGLPNDSKEK